MSKPKYTSWELKVKADLLERILAFLEPADSDDELGQMIESVMDDDQQLRAAVDDMRSALHHFAEANPEFDERDEEGEEDTVKAYHVNIGGRGLDTKAETPWGAVALVKEMLGRNKTVTGLCRLRVLEIDEHDDNKMTIVIDDETVDMGN
jgi:hypothetical protein